MKIAISTESTADLPKELLEEYQVHTVAFNVLLGEEERKDGTFDPKEIFEYVQKTKVLPKTSAVNEFTYEEHFTNLLNSYDAVVHISLSSSLSSSCQNAKNAASKLNNVYVIDSQSLSTGIGLLVIYASRLAQKGVSAAEIAKSVSDRIPHVQASFVLERLDYLYKGGRCSALSLFGANLLKIRPQIVVKDGKMGAGKKYRGTIERCVDEYCKDTIAEFNTPDLYAAFVTYTTATPAMIESAKNALKARGFKNIYESVAGGTISSHCGEHTLGILYINDEK